MKDNYGYRQDGALKLGKIDKAGLIVKKQEIYDKIMEQVPSTMTARELLDEVANGNEFFDILFDALYDVSVFAADNFDWHAVKRAEGALKRAKEIGGK